MKKTSIAVAALLTTMAATTIAPVAYAADNGVQQTNACKGNCAGSCKGNCAGSCKGKCNGQSSGMGDCSGSSTGGN